MSRIGAVLALADGRCFVGSALGAGTACTGEVVFNTSMTGYQEILSDPSYTQQIVVLTHPHIGNTGINRMDRESDRAHASGLVVRDYNHHHSSWRSEESLSKWLKAQNKSAICDVDTRALTTHIRSHGAQSACILCGNDVDTDQAVQRARAFDGLENKDLASTVSRDKVETWSEPGWNENPDITPKYRVVVYDYGVKNNILRTLVDHRCKVVVVPATTTAQQVLDMHPDGVLLSNGPGDPSPCEYAITAIRTLLRYKMPLFGICLGHQLLALACSATTVKMKFGHHGANHPVQSLRDGNIMITSQNHGFSVDEQSIPTNLEITHRSLFDGTIQGIMHRQLPVFGFQGHPEASPGPHDIAPLFQQFCDLMDVHSPNFSR